eukprot:TRINITY_DN20804_c0_g1_i1.p1 TRINITY_DN20804_c0_g1~~TRINITY_DN20804_c0_g1_i1.p1  ORF type:complete len:342 (+),score=89.25 TRINITY_DN20804_c0_g1_i1:65-1027(+)
MASLSRTARGALQRQARWRGSTHTTLNWHHIDVHTEHYHSLSASTTYEYESMVFNHRKSDYKWDSVLSPILYYGAPVIPEPDMRQPMPYWLNDHLFARTYWNTNLNLFYWSHYHLNFYYVERKRMPYKSVFTNNFVYTPRWAYNLVLMYTKHNRWDITDIGLRMKTLLYVNSHIWLVFKFKMHKVARLNGIERGIKVFSDVDRPAQVASTLEKNRHTNLNHYVMDETPKDHRSEGAGTERVRNYAHVSTLAGPAFAKEHLVGRKWWWHAYPAKRKRWEASNPFGHDLVNPADGKAGFAQAGHLPDSQVAWKPNRNVMTQW